MSARKKPISEVMRVVQPWLDDDASGDLGELMRQVQWLGRELYGDYEPNAYESFDERFGKWIGNVGDELDQKILFQLLRHLFFVGRREFEALCRSAFTGPVTRWLIDMENIPVDAPDAANRLAIAIEQTWFCPVTDSMRINAFLKLNHVEGKQFRPDWRSLARFADKAKLDDYMTKNHLRRIVLLEDFVGSGLQMSGPAEFAASSFPDLGIMLCPLVCGPKGVQAGERLEKKYPNLRFAPILRIPDDALIHVTAQPGEPPIFEEIRRLVLKTSGKLAPNNQPSPFGFKKVGALVVMYSNCPNNTLPVIHNDSEGWQALFPRIRRN